MNIFDISNLGNIFKYKSSVGVSKKGGFGRRAKHFFRETTGKDDRRQAFLLRITSRPVKAVIKIKDMPLTGGLGIGCRKGIGLLGVV
jgi:hypothetical protein